MAIHTAFPADGYTRQVADVGRRRTIEELTLRWENEAWTASGEVGREQVQYVMRLSPTWQVRQFLLFRDLDEPDLWLATDGHARWGEMNGAHRPELDGCHDIDLACTPFTNTLPIRRLPLHVGDSAELAVITVDVETLAVAPTVKRYHHVDERHVAGVRPRRAAPRSTSTSTSTASSSTSPTTSAAAEIPFVCVSCARGCVHADRSARKTLRSGPMSGSARRDLDRRLQEAERRAGVVAGDRADSTPWNGDRAAWARSASVSWILAAAARLAARRSRRTRRA